MATANPNAQARNQFGRDWGNYAAPTNLPNCSAWAGSGTTNLEAGDRAYVTTTSPGCYYCVSPGTSGLLDAVWELELPPNTLIYQMPIATASLGTEVFVRNDGNLPAAPTGTFSKSIVNVTATPGAVEKALRLQVTSGNGGWVAPLQCGTLPSKGYVIEVDFSDIDASSIGGFIMPVATFSGVTVQGIAAQLFSGLNNMAAQVAIQTTTYARVLGLASSVSGWSSSPNTAFSTRGPYSLRVEVRKRPSQTPACWQQTFTTRCPSGSNVLSSAVSGVETPIAALNALALAQVGIGVWVPNGSGPATASMDIQSLRILSLDR